MSTHREEPKEILVLSRAEEIEIEVLGGQNSWSSQGKRSTGEEIFLGIHRGVLFKFLSVHKCEETTSHYGKMQKNSRLKDNWVLTA